jgi:hypothetical protein
MVNFDPPYAERYHAFICRMPMTTRAFVARVFSRRTDGGRESVRTPEELDENSGSAKTRGRF